MILFLILIYDSVFKRENKILPFSVDFQVHTEASKDSLTSPEKLIMIARRRALDRIVIPDYITLTRAIGAHTLDPELAVSGEEIMTTQG
jgi:predicted metal-dependent phosphoesterase TrpH